MIDVILRRRQKRHLVLYNLLKGLFTIFSTVDSAESAGTWVSCKIALYVGCTTYSSECISVGLFRVLLAHYQKPNETHIQKKIVHLK